MFYGNVKFENLRFEKFEILLWQKKAEKFGDRKIT